MIYGKRPLVLTAGKNPRNLELLARFLKREGYAALDCHNLQELEETLKKKIAFFVISSREEKGVFYGQNFTLPGA